MKENMLNLANKLLGFTLASALALLAVLAMHLDINIFDTGLQEVSFTEGMQEGLLLVTVLLYLFLARKNAEMRPALVLVAGFFACMFIRELDSFFSFLGLHWLPLALLAAGAAIFYAAKRPQSTLGGLVKFSETQPFALLMGGLLTVLVFSRLFGMKSLWIGLLGQDYPRPVKNFAEEGIELFGYVQCFFASACYAFQECRSKARAYSETATLLGSEATERPTS